jgi:hypothetical protein
MIPVIQYRPYVATREDGSQILVSVFLDPEGHLDSIQVAERGDRFDSWQAPLPIKEAP